MEEVELLNVILRDSGCRKDSSLVAECLCSITNYLNINEDGLLAFQWVEKNGTYKQMIPDNTIRDILIKRAEYLDGYENQEARINEVGLDLLHIIQITELFKLFSSSRGLYNRARSIRRLERLSQPNDLNLDFLSDRDRQPVIDFLLSIEDWNLEFVSDLIRGVNHLADSILFLLNIKVCPQEFNRNDLKKDLLLNWFRINADPQLLYTVIQNIVNIEEDGYERFINKFIDIVRLNSINAVFFDIALLFFKEIEKMEASVPALANEAINTGNPFLFRSLFLSFDEAKEFAVGGKLNSSLETKYGSLFEKLMFAFKGCRGIFNGGIDVAVEETALDVKSGPNVMNQGMVNAFLAKKLLIEERNILPGLNTYKIALGYGKREDLNPFMAPIETHILTGREAWLKITGLSHSPEIVFEIAALVARIFKSKSLVSTMLGQDADYQTDPEDDIKFRALFDNMFAPINLLEVDTDNYIERISSLARN